MTVILEYNDYFMIFHIILLNNLYDASICSHILCSELLAYNCMTIQIVLYCTFNQKCALAK